nr:dihydrodipicolinate synthase family protein [uncultured Acetatifactor sp.]
MKRLYGVITAMVTPFDENGQVMLEQIRNMVEFLVKRGVNCLYPCGTTGEMFLMHEEDRKKVAQTVVEQNRGRLTTYIHVGAMDPDETIRLAQHACDIGADGVGIVTPAFFGTNPDAMVEYYVKVLHAIPQDFPAYLYNIPQLAANDLTSDTIGRILELCPNVAGIKYSYADMARTYEYLGIARDFEVVQGADSLFLPTLAMGCAGTVSGCSSVYPEPFVKVYEAFRAGDIETARSWQNLANKFVRALGAGSNMAIFKSGLQYRGLMAGHMHRPQIDLKEDQAQELWKTLRALEEKCPEGMIIRD